MNNSSGWQSLTGFDVEALPPEQQTAHQERRNAELTHTPIAEITINLYRLESGGAQVQVRISEQSELNAALSSGLGRSDAYNKLIEHASRELQSALSLLRDLG